MLLIHQKECLAWRWRRASGQEHPVFMPSVGWEKQGSKILMSVHCLDLYLDTSTPCEFGILERRRQDYRHQVCGFNIESKGLQPQELLCSSGWCSEPFLRDLKLAKRRHILPVDERLIPIYAVTSIYGSYSIGCDSSAVLILSWLADDDIRTLARIPRASLTGWYAGKS